MRFACLGAETGRVLETDLPDLRSRVDAVDLSRGGCWYLWCYSPYTLFIALFFRLFYLWITSDFSKLTQFLRSLWALMAVPPLLPLLPLFLLSKL